MQGGPAPGQDSSHPHAGTPASQHSPATPRLRAGPCRLAGRAHLAADPHALVQVLGERLPRDEAARALADVDGAVLEDDLTLADDHQRRAVALHALEDVVLHGLRATVAAPYGSPQSACSPGDGGISQRPALCTPGAGRAAGGTAGHSRAQHQAFRWRGFHALILTPSGASGP